MNAKYEKWANALRDKYNKILAQNGSLSDQDYQNMVADVEKCTDKDESCRSAMFDVLEKFQKEYDGR